MTSLGTAVAEVLIDTLTSAARIAEPDGHDLGEIMNALTDLLAALTDLLAALTDDREGTTVTVWHPLAAD